MLSNQSINKYSVNTSPCSTQVTISKTLVFPSRDRNVVFVFLCSVIIVVTVSCRDHRQVVFAPISYCVWNRMP